MPVSRLLRNSAVAQTKASKVVAKTNRAKLLRGMGSGTILKTLVEIASTVRFVRQKGWLVQRRPLDRQSTYDRRSFRPPHKILPQTERLSCFFSLEYQTTSSALFFSKHGLNVRSSSSQFEAAVALQPPQGRWLPPDGSFGPRSRR
jgi:hypothetical protein